MTEPIQLHLQNNQKHENFRTQEEDPIIITTQ